jgi:phosphoglycolate phosphatase-like HAD superfamily hydrolase
MSSDLNTEADFQQIQDPSIPGEFLPGTSIEVIRAPASAGNYRHVIFDFDGTLSLIREGWPDVMVPMMVEFLLSTGTEETEEELSEIAMDFVMRLTGKQTLYQMLQLSEEIKKRGGKPKEPLEYKHIYHDRLMAHIRRRRDALASGESLVEEFLVPGSMNVLQDLVNRGCRCYLASGTDEIYVIEEAALLGLRDFFEGGIYGAQTDVMAFSKAMVIQRIFEENNVDGTQLLGFGDGYVEIENVRAAGGTAIAVASDESNKSGKPDAWKRDRLIGAGADIVIPDFRESESLLQYLFGT